jgi:hypothetical protein
MSVLSHHTRTYTTSSGVDITALFDNLQVMTLQGIAISVTREKIPIYILGRARPVSVSRGKRGIAGTMQFVLFDRDALYTLMHDIDHYYYAHADEINWLNATHNMANYQAEIGNENQRVIDGESYAVATSTYHPAEYMDQIFPFDVTLIAQNEYGNGSFSSILGCEIINEGGGISMDDLSSETQSTYIALHRLAWTPLERQENQTSYSATNIGLDDEGNLYTNSDVSPDGRVIGSGPALES